MVPEKYLVPALVLEAPPVKAVVPPAAPTVRSPVLLKAVVPAMELAAPRRETL